MMLFGVALALGSAVAHAVWNTLLKNVAARGLVALWGLSFVAMALALPVAGVVVARQGVGVLTGELFVISAASVAVHTVYMVGLQYSYKHCDMSAVYPLSRGLAPSMVAVAAVAVVHQVPSPVQVAGLGLMAGAVLALCVDGRREESTSTTRTVVAGTLAACSIAGYTVVDGWAIVVRGLDPLLFYTVSGVLQFFVLTVALGRRLPEGAAFLGEHRRRLAAMAVLVPGSYLLALHATLHADLSVVTAVRASSLVWAVLLAACFLGERVGRARVAATGFALASVVAMTAPTGT